MKCSYAGCAATMESPGAFCSDCSNAYCSSICKSLDLKQSHAENCGKSPGFALEDFQEVDDVQMRVLGKGTYGEVRLVKHRSGDLYAMKVIDKHSIVDEEALYILKREIQVHKNLSHRHITKLYDHFEDEDNVYLLLEYASKGALFYKARRQTRLTEDEARKFFKQATEGILYLHLNHIIHRDLKPENILLDSKENVKICDFGWCVKTTELRTTFCGTLDYMAPEMFSPEGHSFEVDLWALGVLLYELLHGKPPFSASTETDVGLSIVKCQYKIGKHVSEEAADLIRQLLTFDPERRLQAAEILRHSWVEKWNDRPIGGLVSCVVPGYGRVEGIVKEIVGEECIIYHELLDESSSMPLAEVSELISHPQRNSTSDYEGDDPRDDNFTYRNSLNSRPTKNSFRPPINIFTESSAEDRYLKTTFAPSSAGLYDSLSQDKFMGGKFAERREHPAINVFGDSTAEDSPKLSGSFQSMMVEDSYAIVGRLFDDKSELQDMRTCQQSYFLTLAKGWGGLDYSKITPLKTQHERGSFRSSDVISKEILMNDQQKPRPSKSTLQRDNSQEVLRLRKLELDKLTLQLQGGKKKKEVKSSDEKEDRGFFSWFGDLIGCTKRN
mmetsp:Transcript_20714/g.38561  ORF Transcript_20714/g.38561 Transcript_20714/m.38561 type:complete len:612 (-) Transcript_20714:44-1879(-)